MLKKTALVMTLTLLAGMGLQLGAQETTTKPAHAKSASSDHSKMKQKKMIAKKFAYSPSEMKWGDGPPFIPAGAKMSVLDGNPMSDGLFTLRLKVPDGYKVAPHWHPKREEVTVISGTLDLGMGDKFDSGKLTDYPAGSFFYMDPEMHHFAQAKGETEIQIHGRGPVQFKYIDPNDDPSKKK